MVDEDDDDHHRHLISSQVRPESLGAEDIVDHDQLGEMRESVLHSEGALTMSVDQR